MIIYIDGPTNSGKTTVSKLLCARSDRTIHVEIDDLRHFADCLALDEVIPFALEDAISVTRNWHARGFDVVVSWPINSENHKIFVEAMQNAGADLLTFTMFPREDVCLRNRAGRELEEREIYRIKQMYAGLRLTGPIGIQIDNSDQCPDETVDKIVSKIAEKWPNKALQWTRKNRATEL